MIRLGGRCPRLLPWLLTGPVSRRLHLLFVFVLCLGFSASCTFERRPQAQADQDTGQIQTPPSEESASAFLQRLQDARREGHPAEPPGAPADLGSLVHPDVVVLVDGRPFSPLGGEEGEGAGEADAWNVLAGVPGEAGGEAGGRSEVTDSALFDRSALFVVRYAMTVETLLLARDSTGWSLRFLHRVSDDAGSSGASASGPPGDF